MAGAAGCFLTRQTGGRAGRARRDSGTAGSLLLRRMDRRVRAKKHGTKSGTGALLRRGFSFGEWCLTLHSERVRWARGSPST